MSQRRLLCILAALVAMVSCAQKSPPHGVDQVLQALEQDFHSHQYERGYAQGSAALERFPQSSAVAAWFALNAARAWREDRALAVARGLMAKDPLDPWAQFATAGVNLWMKDRGPEGIA